MVHEKLYEMHFSLSFVRILIFVVIESKEEREKETAIKSSWLEGR